MNVKATGRSSAGTQSFSQFLPFDEFMTFIRLESTGGEDWSAEHREAWQEAIKNVMKPALKGFLTRLKDRGLLEPIPGSAGRLSLFMDAWNAITTDSDAFKANPDRQWSVALHNLAHDLAFRSTYKATGEETDTRQRYEALVAQVNKGDFRRGCVDSETCQITGEHMSIDIEGWKVRMTTLSKDRQFVPIEPVVRPGVVELEINLRTGHLLIADWFRIEEFTEVVRVAFDDLPSLNSVAGREAHSKHYAESLGFICVSVGNTSPSVVDVDGTLVFGRGCNDDGEINERADGVTELGMVCTDLWAVTIIERERLVEIVAQSLGREEAELTVAKYIEQTNFVTQVSVDPGTYHLYFSGDKEGFASNFRSPDLDLEGRVEPMFVLSPRRLELIAQPSVPVL